MKRRQKVYKKRDMIAREIDNELILMPNYKSHAEKNEMYTLNKTAAAMWNLIDGRRTLQEISDELCSRYSGSRQTIEADLEEFINDLKTLKAIE